MVYQQQSSEQAARQTGKQPSLQACTQMSFSWNLLLLHLLLFSLRSLSFHSTIHVVSNQSNYSVCFGRFLGLSIPTILLDVPILSRSLSASCFPFQFSWLACQHAIFRHIFFTFLSFVDLFFLLAVGPVCFGFRNFEHDMNAPLHAITIQLPHWKSIRFIVFNHSIETAQTLAGPQREAEHRLSLLAVVAFSLDYCNALATRFRFWSFHFDTSRTQPKCIEQQRVKIDSVKQIVLLPLDFFCFAC